MPLKPSLIALIERRYDAIIAAGMAFHEAQRLGDLSNRGRVGSLATKECQSALNSFQVTAPKSFQLIRPVSAVFCAV